MFTKLFHGLRQEGVPVSLREYLDLLRGMDAGLADYDVDHFYYLARSLLVKDERNLDRFDRVFGEAFKGLERTDPVAEEGIDIPKEWLEKLAELLYRNFSSYHTSKTLQDLLAVIGSDRRDEVISKEVVLILANPIFCALDAEFMISVGKIDETERFILERGYTKAYPHGVRYLKKLDNLATSITQWMKFDNHEMFKDQIYLSHGRKYSFWSKYEL